MTHKRLFQLVIAIFSIVLIFVVVYFVIQKLGISKKVADKDKTLTIWHPYLSEKVFAGVISEYEKSHPGVEINYHKYEGENYELDALRFLASGEGPTIWAAKNDWMAQHYDKFLPAPEGLFVDKSKREKDNVEGYKNTFAPVAAEDNIVDGKIYAVPMSVDTLALYYNTSKVSSPPKTWEDLVGISIAIGGSNNINQAADILSLLMLQNHTPMISEDKQSALFNTEISKPSGETVFPGTDALRYYTSFARDGSSNKTWDANRKNTSLEAFAKGDLAMTIDYSRAASEIKKQNPSLSFAVAKIPQIKGSEAEINYGSYWNFGVTRSSKNPELAWDFLKFLTSKENALNYYKETKEAPARLDLLEIAKQSNFYGVFAEQVETAVSWKKREFNSYDRIFREAIDAVVKYGVEPQIALDTAAKEVTNILVKPELEVRGSAGEGQLKNLVIWRTRDSKEIFQKIIEQFEKNNKQVKVIYEQKNPDTFIYETLNALAAGKGPDIISLKNIELPKYRQILNTVPSGMLADPKEKLDDQEKYRQTFLDAIAQDNIIDGNIYGLPLGIDILKLYYNRELAREIIREDARTNKKIISDDQQLLVRGPRTWEEMKKIIAALTVAGYSQSVVGLGEGSNISYSPDILSNLMLQFGAQMVRLDKNIAVFNLPLSGSSKNPGLEAFDFYLGFNWDKTNKDVDKFLENDLLMMFGYSDLEGFFQKKNPSLSFEIESFPQFLGENEATYPRYWTEAVTKTSLYPDLAWKFNILAAGQMRDYYTQITELLDARKPDRPTIVRQEDKERMAAKTWYQVDPEKIDQIFREMIDAAASKTKTPQQALNDAANKVNVIMRRMKEKGY